MLILLITVSFTILLYLGLLFQKYIVLADLTDSDTLTSFIFAGIFTLCCLVAELPIARLLLPGRHWRSDSEALWTAGLSFIVLATLVLLPALLAWRVHRRAGFRPPTAAIGTLTTIFIVKLLFWTAGAFLPGVPPKLEHENPFSLRQAISRMAVVGTTLLAVFVGYGAVHAPYVMIGRFVRPVSDQSVAEADLELKRSLDLTAHKKRRLAVMTARLRSETERGKHPRGDHPSGFLERDERAHDTSYRTNSSSSTSTSTSTSTSYPKSLPSRTSPLPIRWAAFVRRTRRSIESLLSRLFSHSTLQSEVNVVKAEVAALETLTRELSLAAVAIRDERRRAREKFTTWGQIKSVLGYLFAGYCVFRVGMAVMAAIQDETSRPDPVSVVVGWVVWTISGGRVHVDKLVVRQVTTFLFIVVVLANSFSLFVRLSMRVLSFMPGSSDSGTISLLFCDVLCFYTTAAVMLVVERLPEAHRNEILTALGGDLEFGFLARWFNGLLFVVAVVSAGLLYVGHRSRDRSVQDRMYTPLTKL